MAGGVSLSGLTGTSSTSKVRSPFGVAKKRSVFGGLTSLSSCHERFAGFMGLGSRWEDAIYPESAEPFDEKGCVKVSAERGKTLVVGWPCGSRPP